MEYESGNELYHVLEDQAADRQNQLLFLLTVFSMISGIYGMNLVIDDWKNGLTFADITKYNFFEWIAFSLTVVGIFLSFILVTNFIYQWAGTKIKEHLRKQKR